MRNKSVTLPISAIGVIVVLFTLAMYFLLDIERNALNRWALGFLLLSEVIMFGGLIALRRAAPVHSSVFVKSGVTAALSLYFATTINSVFLSGLFTNNLNAFILIELGILALFAIVTITILAFSGSIGRRSNEDASKTGSNEAKRGGF